MRTKTLLLSAATLVAGILSSQAQSNVYSANIVGYVNVVLPGNGKFQLMANPFDDGNGNYLTNLFATNAIALPKQSQILVWDPVGSVFNGILKGGNPPNWPANTTNTLPPGTGFFVRNGAPGGPAAPDLTNTFVGSIIVLNGGSVTNVIPPSYSLKGSPIPYVGLLAINGQGGGDTNMNFGNPLGKTSQILTWDPVGQVYLGTLKGGGSVTWGGNVTNAPGQGFFILNKASAALNGPTTNVVETLNVQ